MTRLVMVVLLAALPATAAAQRPGWEIGATAGGGPSLVTEAFGGVPGQHLYVTTVFARHSLVRWKSMEASYVGSVLPVVVAAGVVGRRGVGTDRGVGFAPIALQIGTRVTRWTSIFVEGAGGVVAFARPMPTSSARSQNFLVSAGGGIRLGYHRGFVLGYRFTHLSNANTAWDNPGFNAHVFFLGMTLL